MIQTNRFDYPILTSFRNSLGDGVEIMNKVNVKLWSQKDLREVQ